MMECIITAATQIALSRYQAGELSSAEIHREIERQARVLEDLSAYLRDGTANEPCGGFSANNTDVPAVPIAESVTDNFIICLEDGGRFRMLKRHLRNRYGMTPDQYRAKWGLPDHYPMTAPAYSKRRSAIAKLVGLGTHDRSALSNAA